MYAATYPTPKQQLRYISLGAVAVGFVVTLLLISVGVS
ncbi:MAG: ssl1498 family light-harvesting-like protein [Cyanobacteriota bacterium]|nr:ssl1498 family light-harvesting-like protein [Cyanobacteriota bacterium]